MNSSFHNFIFFLRNGSFSHKNVFPTALNVYLDGADWLQSRLSFVVKKKNTNICVKSQNVVKERKPRLPLSLSNSSPFN